MGVPSWSTANRTPEPKGQPSWVKVESVPTDESSMIVLDTSAGVGLVGVGAAIETKHLKVPEKDLGRLQFRLMEQKAAALRG